MMSRRTVFVTLFAAGTLLTLAGKAPVFNRTATAVPVRIPASSTTLPSSSTAALLADCVPGDIMLYLELRSIDGILGGQTGIGAVAGLVRALKDIKASGGDVPPADKLAARDLLAGAVGLTDPEASQLLFSGPLAIAADGWSGLSDAILVVRPANPTALETRLAAQQITTPTQGKVRQYKLNRDNVLACDGRSVVIGRSGKRTGLLARTVELLEGGGNGNLAEQAEFRERIAALPATSHLTLYAGKANAGMSAGADPLTAWWPEDWPHLKTVALGIVLGPESATIEVSSRLDPEGPHLKRSEPPIQIIRRLPKSVLAAWTQAIDYVGDFRRLRTKYSQDPDGFRWEALEAGLDPGTIERRLLSHLVGDTVIVIDRIMVKPQDASDPNERLILPTASLMVETDDPDAVASVLGPLANNLMRVLSPPSSPDQAVNIKSTPLAPNGPSAYVLPLGKAWATKNRCDLLPELELCVTMADRWLIVGTNPRTVYRLVKQRHGTAATLPAGDLDQIMEQVSSGGGQPRRVMFADPPAIASMIQTWVQHLDRHHPEMLQGQWWDKVLRRQRAMGKQLGILVRPSGGMVEVVDTLPGGPSRDRLQSGDRIMAVDGMKIDPSSPLKSLREYVAGRPEADHILLQVRRGNETKEITLPLPGEPVSRSLQSPIDLLKRITDLSRLFSSASYVLWQPRPDIVDARIDLRYFTSPVTVPATSPTVH